ncbi:MAG: hypothetical protein GY722_19575, partial [bacterium]|nr:hypothetical protein [bacterium]
SGTTGLQADYGSDGAGSLSYALTLTQTSSQSGDIFSGIYALDSSDTSTADGDGYGQGDELILVDGSNLTGGTAGVIYGVIASATDAADSYFTIANSGTTVTFSQQQNVWHNDTARFDEGGPQADSGRLIVTNGSLGLEQTVTDADGDSASSTADLSGSSATGGFSVFSIQDDGPISSTVSDTGTVLQGLAASLTLDETRPVGSDRADTANGETAQTPDGTASASADLATVFSDADSGTTGLQADYGSDGAGSLSYALTLTQTSSQSGDIFSGIYALDSSDT